MFLNGFRQPDSQHGNSNQNQSKRNKTRRRHLTVRSLRVEGLEDRSLLSISPFSPPTATHLIGPAVPASNVSSPAASAATHFVVTMSPGVHSGDTVNVFVTAEDANNHLATSYSGSADVSSSDASATLPSGPVTFSHGHATFQVSLVTLGSQSVTVTDEADSTITGDATTNVAAAPTATHFAVYLPSGATTGKAVTAQVLAFDADNHFVANYTGPATVTSSDGSAVLPTPVTFTNGHANFQVTFNTTGSQSVTVTDNADRTITGSSATNVIAPIAITHFVIALPQGVAAGSSVSVQLLAEDAGNHVVTGYNGTANLTSTDGAATLPASVQFQNGHANISVTFNTTGAQSITATDSVDPTSIGIGNTNVAIPHYTIHLASGVTAGTAVTVQLVATDDQNHVLTNYNGTANLSSTDAAATLPATATFTNGKASFSVTFVTPGLQTLSAIDSTSTTPVGAATTNVAVAAVATHYAVFFPQNATAGQAAFGIIVAEDADNHVVQSYTGPANFSSSDGGATLPASVNFEHGYATFKVTFAASGVQQLTITDAADSSITSTVSTTVAAAPVATHFVVLLKPGVTAGSPVTVIVVAEDADNHYVPNYSGTASIGSLPGSATFPSTVTFDHGYAKFQVTFNDTGEQTVTVTDSTNSALTGSASTNVIAKSSNGWGLGFGRAAAIVGSLFH